MSMAASGQGHHRRERRCWPSAARVFAIGVIGAVSACGSPPAMIPREPAGETGSPASVNTKATPSAPASTPGSGASGADVPADDQLAATVVMPMLAKVSALRELPIRQAVRAQRLGRAEVIARIKSKVARNVPAGVLRAQGEFLAALGLIPIDYDFAQGIFGLLEEQVAGFYDPEVDLMVLLDDLSEAAAEETLAHELVHALQDQHYDLEPKIKYLPHDSDRVAAVQTLSEGDATLAMLQASAGPGFSLSEDALRVALVASMALSESGARTPRVLQTSLIAPYLDGYRIVTQLRQAGGWPAVDAMWRQLPTTTEQLLHPDKYHAREPALEVPVEWITNTAPQTSAPGWQVLDHDVLGEQGLRITAEQWASRETARDVAAGWGGDRYAVLFKPPASQAAGAPASGPNAVGPNRLGRPVPGEYAAAWIIRFDTRRDAGELAAVLQKTFPRKCKARPQLGAIAWLHRGATVVLTVSPFRRGSQGERVTRRSSCGQAQVWASRLLRAIKPVSKPTRTPVIKR